MGQIVKRLVILALLPFIILAAALVVVDYLAKDGTQKLIADAVKNSTHSDRATASISSFPFIYDVAAEGKLQNLTVTDYGVPAGVVRLDEVKLAAHDIKFDRHKLIFNHTTRLTSVQSATVTVVFELSALQNAAANLLNVQVVSSSSSQLVITAAGHVVASLNLTAVPIIPQCPLNVVHNGASYTFSCTVSPVPPSVLDALSKIKPATPSVP